MPPLLVRAEDQSVLLPFVLVFVGIPVIIAVTILLRKYARYGGQSATNARRGRLALFTPWEWKWRKMLHFARPWFRGSDGCPVEQGFCDLPSGRLRRRSPYGISPYPRDGGGDGSWHLPVLGRGLHRYEPSEVLSSIECLRSDPWERDRGFCSPPRRPGRGHFPDSFRPPPKRLRGRRNQPLRPGYCKPPPSSEGSQICDSPCGGRGWCRPIPTASGSYRFPSDLNYTDFVSDGTCGGRRPRNWRDLQHSRNKPQGFCGRRHSIGGFEFRDPRFNFPTYDKTGRHGFDRTSPVFPGGKGNWTTSSDGDEGHPALPFPIHERGLGRRFLRRQEPNPFSDGSSCPFPGDFPRGNPGRVRGRRHNSIALGGLDDTLRGHHHGPNVSRERMSKPMPERRLDPLGDLDNPGHRRYRKGGTSRDGVGLPNVGRDGWWGESRRQWRAKW
jgi:hypothetical protein